ncbi:unnamed protein product [Tenebrio molitor]|nr:unnamed protein product [Tenebrio molitor]
MIVTSVSKYPYRISFTQSISVNYELGVKMVKFVYSAFCFLIRLKGVLY